jgi:hypothetical protein
MQVGTKAAPRGSFSYPPGMSPEEVIKKAKEQAPPAKNAEAVEVEEEGEDVPKLSDESRFALTELQKLGVEMSSDDWNSLYFAGYVEKDLKLQIPDPATKSLKDFIVTVRTPTGDQADLADELFAEELSSANITKEGAINRKNMWNFAFAVQKINGRELCRPVSSDGSKKIDVRKTVAAKRKVLSQMSPVILKHASIKYSRFVEFLDMLVEDPNQAFFAKP